METRIEKDAYGEIHVPADKYWGIHTQRALDNMPMNDEKMPFEFIQAYALLKRAVAEVNYGNGDLSKEKFIVIKKATLMIEEGDLENHFPLSIWHRNSSEAIHQNVNEVIANYGNNQFGNSLLNLEKDVNKNQHTNDSFPTAMFIASYGIIRKLLIPEIDNWIEMLSKMESEAGDRTQKAITHFQPKGLIRLSDELSGWREALMIDKERLKRASVDFRYVAFGGGEVGSGENLPENFADDVAERIASYTGEKFGSEKNKYLGLSIRGEYAFAQGALQSLTATLSKIANELQLHYSPLFERNDNQKQLSQKEMNAAQNDLELLQQAIMQVIGNGTTIQMAISQSHFQTNSHLSLIIYSFIQSIKVISEIMSHVRKNAL